MHKDWADRDQNEGNGAGTLGGEVLNRRPSLPPDTRGSLAMSMPDGLAQSLFVSYPILDVANREAVDALQRLGDAQGRLQVRAALHELAGALANLYEVRLDLMAIYDFPGQEAYKAGYLQLKRFLEMEILAFDLGAGATFRELIGHVASWLKADVTTVDRPLVHWLQEAAPPLTVPVWSSYP